MDYRREIDGLRAIAVLPVILFHAGFQLFGGGFVGVDIFFVISGYLITTILVDEMDQGRFSLVNFYERRARRILPALFLVCLFTFLCSWIWLIPRDMNGFAKSLVGVATFSSNFVFLSESGYFDTATELKPLLHTWSLAVEEQFYIVFPLLLILLRRIGQNVPAAILGLLFLASLGLAQWGAHNHPDATFYLLPARGWELLIGAFCAFHLRNKGKPLPAAASQLASLAGVAMILYSIFVFDKSTPFPSLHALVPTIGTALIILFAVRGTLANRLLSASWLVGIGLVSYSAYLWHQPLLAFAKYRSMEEPSPILLSLLVAATFLLAYLTYRFVETPFRARTGFDRKAIFRLSGLAGAALALTGFSGITLNGFEDRSTSSDRSYAEIGLPGSKFHASVGLPGACEGFSLAETCRTSEAPRILVWGDSFAKHSVYFVREVLGDGIQQLTLSDCAPVIGGSERSSARRTLRQIEECGSFNQSVLAWLRANPAITTIVLGSRFSMLERMGESGPASPGLQHFADAMLSGLDEIKAILDERDGRVLIFPPTPETGRDIGFCAMKIQAYGLDEGICDFDLSSRSTFASAQKRLMDILDSHVFVFDLEKVLCPEQRCLVIQDGVRLYRDKGHLTNEGARHLGIVYRSSGDLHAGRAASHTD